MAVNLYEHQKRAVDMLSSGSVLCGGVGTGKSRTALAYYFNKVCGGKIGRAGSSFEPMKNQVPLYIITTAKKRDSGDWDSEMTPFLLSRKKGEGSVDVVVDSWNKIGSYVNVTDAFFIFDEQRLVGTGAWTKAFLKIAKKNQWILLTATPGDNWLDYASVFIANGYYKNITEFRNLHVVYDPYSEYPKVKNYVRTRRLEAIRNKIVVPMEYKKVATQHHEWIKVGYDESLYEYSEKNYWNIYKNEPSRTASEMCYSLRRVVNDDTRRCVALKNILSNHPKVVLFYNFDYELYKLRDFLSSIGYPYSEWNGHLHEDLLTGDRWVYLVQYTAGAEGWNCVETNTMVFYSQNYSWKIMDQAAGRIDRMNTPFTDLFYYHFFSDSGIDKSIRQSVKRKKTFSENNYAKSLDKMRKDKDGQLEFVFV